MKYHLIPLLCLESLLVKHPAIAFAVLFGRGRTRVGVLLQPNPEFQFDPTDTVKYEEFRDSLW